MRLTSVSVYSDESQKASFDLRPSLVGSKYIVKTIVGLDADEIIPRFHGFSKDGKKRFYNLSLKPREIAMRIVLNPLNKINETNSDIRDELYRLISSTLSSQIELQFNSGASVVSKIYGHIVKFEVPYFSNIPELQLTVRCNDPMFRGIAPFRREASELPTTNTIIIPDNVSTAPHGFTMELTFNETVSEFTIQDKEVDPEWEFKVIPADDFIAGDVLYFSSEFKNRYLYFARAGIPLHLLDRIVPGSIWPIIFPLFNEFYFANIDSFDWTYLSFNSAYWGV